MSLLTEEIVALEAAELAADGHRYTPRQLYYAACAAVEVPRIALAPGTIGVGVIMLLVAVIVAHFPVVAIALASLGGLVIVMGLRMRILEAHRLVAVRARAMSYDEFEHTFLSRLETVAEAFPGMLDVADWKAPSRLPAKTALVVCDSVENAVLVGETLRREAITATVIDVDAAGQRIRGRAGVVAVHDASPRGCALPLTLADAGARMVVDAGVRPRDVDGRDLQIIEGAPGVRPPRDLAPVLTTDEVAWLGSGRRLELAAYPTENLITLLRVALGIDPGDNESD